MELIKIDFRKTSGKIKNMNSVNNGPFKSVRSFDTFDAYKAARIPYARNHDASFYANYGGEFTVDVHRIFRDFDKDENDPNSYSFASTDNYLQTICDAGTKVFYRLGCNIEHYEKCGTFPPKDNLKWAKICEHIIKHYTQGWANGFFMDIEYWEIWNEPDCKNSDGSNPCWQGTEDEFVEFFAVAFKHLKSSFPHLKIGGPSFAYLPVCRDFAIKLLERLNKENLKLDFFSYHCYASDASWLTYMINYANDLINEHGQGQAELILNEWNYIKGWLADEWKYSLKAEKGLKGSSFVICAMCTGQRLPVDMLMYYDARPCAMNGLFNTDTFECLKSYYSIFSFSNLIELGTYVKDECSSESIYVCSATNGKDCGVLLTHYNDNDCTDKTSADIVLSGIPKNSSISVYILDENNDMTLYNEITSSSTRCEIILDLPLFTSYYIEIKEI